MNKKVLLFLCIVMPAGVFAKDKNYFSKQLKVYSESEQKKIVHLYREAAEKDIYPDIIQARIHEACAKKVPFGTVFQALQNTVNNLQWIKKFARTEQIGFNRKGKDINRILISMQNGLAKKDIQAIRQDTKDFISDKHFAYLTQHISLLVKNKLSFQEQRRLLKNLKANGYDQHETVRLFKNLNRMEEHHVEAAMKRTVQQIQNKESFRTIESEIKKYRQEHMGGRRGDPADTSRDRRDNGRHNEHGRGDRTR